MPSTLGIACAVRCAASRAGEPVSRSMSLALGHVADAMPAFKDTEGTLGHAAVS